jgi:2-polyprenyl-3-methyl-5-hydroxy-6-metoxy-1,4-benzoquinol methylase
MKRVELFDINTNIENIIFHLSRYKFVRRQIDSSVKLIEIGCGTGYGSYFLSKYCNSVLGIDIDQDSIEKCKRFQKENLSFQKINILNDKEFEFIRNLEFDVVVCFEVIEHMSRQRALKLLKRIKKIKKEKGFAFISTVKRLPSKEKTRNRQIHHVHEYSIDAFRNDLKSIFDSVIILSQLDEIIGSMNYKNAWNYLAITV